MMILLAVDYVTHAHGIVMLCSLANKIITATLGATIASLGLHSIYLGLRVHTTLFISDGWELVKYVK